MVRCGDRIVLGFLHLFYKQWTHKTFVGERRFIGLEAQNALSFVTDKKVRQKDKGAMQGTPNFQVEPQCTVKPSLQPDWLPTLFNKYNSYQCQSLLFFV